MALTSAGLAASLFWTLSVSNTPFKPTTQGQDSVSANLTLPGTITNVLAKTYSISASGTQTIDMFATFTELDGASVSPTKVIGVLINFAGASAIAQWSPGASNPLAWFLGGTTPTLTIPAPGFFALGQGVVQTIDATHRNILITETAGHPLTVTVAFLVGP